MTIVIEKKHLFYLIGILIFCAVIFFITKNCGGDQVDYDAKAKDIKINAYAVITISSTITDEYRHVWRDAIEHDGIWLKEENGMSHYCPDFNDALSYTMRRYISEGCFDVIDSLSNVIKGDLKAMDNAPEKYSDVQKTLLAMYGEMNSLVSLTKEPKGSLLTFGSKVNDILISFDKYFKETDLKINVTENELQNKIADVIEIKAQKKREKIDAVYNSNKKAGEEFLAKNATKIDIKTLPCGVQYKVIKEGSGRKPTYTSVVDVHYEGRLIDGTVFDSSRRHGDTPATFQVNRVIKGWQEAITAMPEGSEWEIYIPQELAYGEQAIGNIKPYSMLIFKVELIKVVK